MPIIVVSPFNVINFPEGGGHFWVYMQYVQGLRQLGCEVYWMEKFRSTDGSGARLAPFLARMEQFGLGRNLILYTDGGSNGNPRTIDYVGRARSEAEAIFNEADLLLNFHYAIDPALLRLFRRSALVDIDPGLLQFWISREQLLVPRHDLYFTTGETVGTPAARFPDCGLNWIKTRPPIFVEQWPYSYDSSREAFTTVSNWDADDWIVDRQTRFENTKRAAFMDFADLPQYTSQLLELALYLKTEKDAAERRDLEKRGWRIRLSTEVAHTPEAYQAYIQQSRGEFSCAKRSCLTFQNAWISDRTLCYLASGKPAVVQNTGPSSFLPNGEGLFRFGSASEAAGAFEMINADYARHCRTARKLVETYFDSKQVVRKVLSDALN